MVAEANYIGKTFTAEGMMRDRDAVKTPLKWEVLKIGVT